MTELSPEIAGGASAFVFGTVTGYALEKSGLREGLDMDDIEYEDSEVAIVSSGIGASHAGLVDSGAETLEELLYEASGTGAVAAVSGVAGYNFGKNMAQAQESEYTGENRGLGDLASEDISSGYLEPDE